jgi:multidrug transporter EmrE-like cation transporter
MTPLTWILVISGVLLNAAAQLLLKWATGATGPIALSWDGLTSATPRLLAHFGLWSGITCYVISVVVWILALSRAQVSTVYPLLSIGYIVNAIGATLLLGEALPVSKVAGIAIIISGVFLLTQSHS